MDLRPMELRDIVGEEMDPVGWTPGAAEPFLRQLASGAVVFSPLEEQVIALARYDSLGSLEPPNRLDRAVAFLFGIRSSSRVLADPRLEALRRAVVVAHHRHHLPDAQAVELRGVGFTMEQIHAVEARATAA